MNAEQLLDGLDPEQRSAAESLIGPVCLLAGAGTGKTRAITHRIAYGVATGAYNQRRVLALTFTTRAASELRGRLRGLGATEVATRTFHSAALAQLGYFWPQVVGGTMPRILEGKARVIAQAAQAKRITLDTAALRDLAAEIEWRKVSNLTLDQYARIAHTRALPPTVSPEKSVELQQAYEDLKDERRQLDFEDVLLACAGMIDTEPRVAEAVREQYRFFVVDEYQDVSPLQQRLLTLWLGERQDLCVVGDASQTIYSFAGASPQFLLGFKSTYPEATLVRLETNYRSTATIVDTANRLMHGRAGALRLRANVSTDARDTAPTISEYPSDSAEARAVASSIAEQISAGVKPQDIAILYRINVQAVALETALRDAGVNYHLRGGPRFFDLPEVKQALMMLAGATIVANPDPLFKTVSDILRSLGWTQDAPESRGAVRSRWEALNTLMTMAEEQPAAGTLSDFVTELRERAASHHEPTLAAVTLATLHSAKGLEWDTVYLIGLQDGLVPISYATTDAAIDEERRLLYVGLTRARQRLHLSWSSSGGQNQGGRSTGARVASRFLNELSPARVATR